jgi:lysozyme
MSAVQTLVNKTVGQWWTVTGPDARQCTAIPHQLQVDLGLPIVYGNAKDTYANAPAALYVKDLNTASFVPIEGAIGVDRRGEFGHTWVALGGSTANIQRVLEQNNPVGAKTRIASRDYTGVYGYFTPRVLTAVVAQPTPSTTDKPGADNEGVVNGQGLHGHTQPNTTSPWPWFFDDNEHVLILARTKGENLTAGPYAPSDWWYLVKGKGATDPQVWVPDAYVRTLITPANVPDWTPTSTTPDPTPTPQYSPRPATGLFGVDVSSYQGDIDWPALTGNTDFTIIRAGHVGASFGGGANNTDVKFIRNRDEARKIPEPTAFYWFCYPSLDPKEEAAHFANSVGALQDGESLWADIETNPVEGDHELIQWCRDFKAEVERLTNRKCRGYYNQDFHDRYPGLKEVFGADGVWAAHYGLAAEARPFPEAIAHQYTSSGKLPGATGNLDLNVFFGTVDEFKALGKPLSSVQTPPPTGTPGVDHTLSDKIDAQTSILNQILVIVQHIWTVISKVFK